MNWNISKLDITTHKFKDKYKNEWDYIKKDKFIEKYPNGGYLVLADMKKTPCKETHLTLNNDTNTINLYPFKRKLKYYESVVGYIKVQDSDNSYIRIISNAWLKNIILPFCFILLLIPLLVFLWNFTNKKVPNLDETAVSYSIPGVKNTDPDNNIALPGVSVIKAKANNPTIDFPLSNPEGNQCYMIYNIYDTNGVLLYKSGLIEPGKAVKSFTINKSFPKGNHKLKIKVESRDINNFELRLNDGELVADLEVE